MAAKTDSETAGPYDEVTDLMRWALSSSLEWAAQFGQAACSSWQVAERIKRISIPTRTTRLRTEKPE